MATIRDVAEKAGVNISTVSRVLNGKLHVEEKTRERVMNAVEELGYRPNMLAKALKERRSSTIALVVPNIRNPIFTAMASGVEDMAIKNGYNLFLCNTGNDISIEKSYIESLKERFVDGIIFATATNESEHLLKLNEEGFPMVLLLRHLGANIDAVYCDNYKASVDGTDYLFNKGCRRIAFLGGNRKISAYNERFNGYRDSIESHGLRLEEDLIYTGQDTSFDAGYAAMTEYMKKYPDVDGLIATSDNEAIGAINAVKAAGKNVPGDIKVLGFADLDIVKHFDPPLTVMSQPLYEMGSAAVEMLVERINRGPVKPVRTKVFSTELIPRGSV